jgi:YidC/Oxa1 family membrane protein insertase
VFGGNFGISIIIFTLVMRLITWPLTASQYKASRAMQAIQPQLQELQKKYKGKDPKKLQQETMALYREAGVNPFGCLIPMLVQFPIWIALYQVINASLGEAPESLITLSQRLYPIPYVHQAVPLENDFLIWDLGQADGTLILPVLVALTMYIQQKLITPAPTAAATPQQLQQQQTMQMMTWMMPLMFGFFTLSVPAGLGLYWAMSNVAGVILQYFYMGRRIDWKNMLSFGPPAPAPAARGNAQKRPTAESKSKSQPAAADVSSDDAAADIQISESGEASMGARPPQVRRTKHGRRRGKR